MDEMLGWQHSLAGYESPQHPSFEIHQIEAESSFIGKLDGKIPLSDAATSGGGGQSGDTDASDSCCRLVLDETGSYNFCFCSNCQIEDNWLWEGASFENSSSGWSEPSPKHRDSDLEEHGSNAYNGSTQVTGAREFESIRKTKPPRENSHDSSNPSDNGSRDKKKPQNKNGVQKKRAQDGKSHPIAIINKLDAALQSDETTSVDFKWKSARLFHELRQLMNSELSAQKDGQEVDMDTGETSNPFMTLHLIPSSTFPDVKPSKISPGHDSQTSSPDPPYSITKPYQCTFPKCKYATSSPVDWKRHEEKDKHWPQRRYMCLECDISTTTASNGLLCRFCRTQFMGLDRIKTHNLTCEDAKMKGTTFARKDKLADHLRDDHGAARSDAIQRTTQWSFGVESNWPKECGFCGKSFLNWDGRANHLVEVHFKKGDRIQSWTIPFPRAPSAPCLSPPKLLYRLASDQIQSSALSSDRDRSYRRSTSYVQKGGRAESGQTPPLTDSAAFPSFSDQSLEDLLQKPGGQDYRNVPPSGLSRRRGPPPQTRHSLTLSEAMPATSSTQKMEETTMFYPQMPSRSADMMNTWDSASHPESQQLCAVLDAPLPASFGSAPHFQPQSSYHGYQGENVDRNQVESPNSPLAAISEPSFGSRPVSFTPPGAYGGGALQSVSSGGGRGGFRGGLSSSAMGYRVHSVAADAIPSLPIPPPLPTPYNTFQPPTHAEPIISTYQSRQRYSLSDDPSGIYVPPPPPMPPPTQPAFMSIPPPPRQSQPPGASRPPGASQSDWQGSWGRTYDPRGFPLPPLSNAVRNCIAPPPPPQSTKPQRQSNATFQQQQSNPSSAYGSPQESLADQLVGDDDWGIQSPGIDFGIDEPLTEEQLYAEIGHALSRESYDDRDGESRKTKSPAIVDTKSNIWKSQNKTDASDPAPQELLSYLRSSSATAREGVEKRKVDRGELAAMSRHSFVNRKPSDRVNRALRKSAAPVGEGRKLYSSAPEAPAPVAPPLPKATSAGKQRTALSNLNKFSKNPKMKSLSLGSSTSSSSVSEKKEDQSLEDVFESKLKIKEEAREESLSLALMEEKADLKGKDVVRLSIYGPHDAQRLLFRSRESTPPCRECATTVLEALIKHYKTVEGQNQMKYVWEIRPNNISEDSKLQTPQSKSKAHILDPATSTPSPRRSPRHGHTSEPALHCPFNFTGCKQSFPIERYKAWMLHAETHLRKGFNRNAVYPEHLSCGFCGVGFGGSSSFSSSSSLSTASSSRAVDVKSEVPDSKSKSTEEVSTPANQWAHSLLHHARHIATAAAAAASETDIHEPEPAPAPNFCLIAFALQNNLIRWSERRELWRYLRSSVDVDGEGEGSAIMNRGRNLVLKKGGEGRGDRMGGRGREREVGVERVREEIDGALDGLVGLEVLGV